MNMNVWENGTPRRRMITIFNIDNETEIYGLANGTYIIPHFVMYHTFYDYIARLDSYKETESIIMCGEISLLCPMLILVRICVTEFSKRNGGRNCRTPSNSQRIHLVIAR